MEKAKRRMLTWLVAAALVLSGLYFPAAGREAAAENAFGTSRSQSGDVRVSLHNQSAPSQDWSGFDITVNNQSGGAVRDWIIVLRVPSGTANAFKCWNATFVADGDTIYLYPQQSGGNAVLNAGEMQNDIPGGGFISTYVDAADIQVQQVYYETGSVSQFDYSSGNTNDNTGGGGASSSTDTSTNKDLVIEYNYAKLLQESLYFYDANMCGPQVGETSSLAWRDDCHTADADVSFSQNGKTYRLDLSGGFHDAGDHVKFGLPQGYAAAVLALGYYEFGEAYDELGQKEHLQVIMDYFCDYFRRSTVYDDNTSRSGDVVAFCYQVGDGGEDHSRWEAPEKQQSARKTFFATPSNPATDEVCIAAAALALNYINFGNQEDLKTAKDLFAFARKNSKAVATEGAAGYYNSTDWKDDYAVAAAALYKATKEAAYQSEYEANKGGVNTGWVLAWDSAGSMASVLMEDWKTVAKITDIAGQRTILDGVYSCIDGWGSCRYNAALQFTGLIYDKHNSSAPKYTEWAGKQMRYMLGENPNKRCYVVGYNENASKYPHHRAASRSADAGQINPDHYTLLGALVGGPTDTGAYKDDQGDYNCNEVALDYNAGLVGAAAGLYLAYKNTAEANHSNLLASEEELTQYGVTKYYGDSGIAGTTPPKQTDQPGRTDSPEQSGGEQPGTTNSPGQSGGGQPGASPTPNPGQTLRPGATNAPNATLQPGQTGTTEDDGKSSRASQRKLKLKKKVLRVRVGKKVRIRIKKKAPGDKVKKYKIVGKKIVKVNRKGVVKGRRRGTTRVKVIMRSGASAKCKIIVKKR